MEQKAKGKTRTCLLSKTQGSDVGFYRKEVQGRYWLPSTGATQTLATIM